MGRRQNKTNWRTWARPQEERIQRKLSRRTCTKPSSSNLERFFSHLQHNNDDTNTTLQQLQRGQGTPCTTTQPSPMQSTTVPEGKRKHVGRTCPNPSTSMLHDSFRFCHRATTPRTVHNCCSNSSTSNTHNDQLCNESISQNKNISAQYPQTWRKNLYEAILLHGNQHPTQHDQIARLTQHITNKLKKDNHLMPERTIISRYTTILNGPTRIHQVANACEGRNESNDYTRRRQQFE